MEIENFDPSEAYDAEKNISISDSTIAEGSEDLSFEDTSLYLNRGNLKTNYRIELLRINVVQPEITN